MIDYRRGDHYNLIGSAMNPIDYFLDSITRIAVGLCSIHCTKKNKVLY